MNMLITGFAAGCVDRLTALIALAPDAGDQARLWGFILMGAAAVIAVVVIIVKTTGKKK